MNVWTLSVVPVAFHCATGQVYWGHISVTVGAFGVFSRIVQSVTFGPSVVLLCWAGWIYQMVHKVWFQGIFRFLHPVLTCLGVSHGIVPGVRGGRQGVRC